MIFEEALAKMREGAKIRIRTMPEDEYYQACYVSLPGYTLEESKKNGMSIAWMKGELLHPDMRLPLDLHLTPCKHGYYPQLNLLWLISDEWEVIE